MVDANENDVFPVKPGDWVARHTNSGQCAKVKAVYRDFDGSQDNPGGILVDLVLYDRSGDKTGRESPAMGGPRTFEPACPYSDWYRIERPSFPLTLKWVVQDDGTKVARWHPGAALADRQWRKPERKQAPTSGNGNFDPELEARARLMAAQELRDAARKSGIEALKERAKELEKEAADLMKPI